MVTSPAITKSSSLLILAAWAIVILPTAWGLNYTVQNALKLFRSAPTTAVAGPLK